MAKKARKAKRRKSGKTASPRKKAGIARKSTTSARTTVGKAGRPVVPRAGARALAAAMARPSEEELDLRDRLKSGPRRQAGPPLAGDTPDRTSMAALSNEVIPAPTEPKDR